MLENTACLSPFWGQYCISVVIGALLKSSSAQCRAIRFCTCEIELSMCICLLRHGWKGKCGPLNFLRWTPQVLNLLTHIVDFGGSYMVHFLPPKKWWFSLFKHFCITVGRKGCLVLLLNSYFNDPREFSLWACDLFLLIDLCAFWDPEDNGVFLPVYFVLWSSAECVMKENQIHLVLFFFVCVFKAKVEKE